MLNNNDEETKPLYDLEDLNVASNQIFELDKEEEQEKTSIDIQTDTKFFDQDESPKKQKKKGKLKAWWNKRTKKQKTLIITGGVIGIIALSVGIFFLIKTLTKKEQVEEKKPDVIVQEENYRYENGTLIFLDSNKEEIGKYTCQNQNENLCFVTYYTEEDSFTTDKKVYQDNASILMRTPIINNTYVFINDNPRETDKKITLYNIKNQETIENYQLVKKIEGNVNTVILKNMDGKYGTIDLSGESVTTKINFTMDYLGFISNTKNFLISIQDSRNFIIDETGKSISKALPGNIKNLNDSYVLIENNTGKYEIYNYNAQNTYNEDFEFAELRDDYAILVNDNKAYFRFYDNKKLNEEPIELNNKEYIKTSIYDENNTLVETKQAYSLEENNNIITITIYKNTTTENKVINKLDGLVSKNLKNSSYFDGKLYIYLDQDKKELLGSYTCANKNNIKEGTNELTNCFIAKDTVFEDNDYEVPGTPGTIPIFNERFAFIADNPDLVNDDNKTIVLYDLKKSSSLGKYAEVNTYSYTGTNEITFTTVGDRQVIAKNKSGKFGVIKIGLSDVTGHINFNYSAMELLHDCYVAKDANGYLLLRKSDGASLTSAISYKIRNYNDSAKYVKVINNGKYFIYSYQNNALSTKDNGYKYVELYDKFFVTVDSNNKLNLYTYKTPSNNELENKEIELNIDNYYGNGTLAFKVSTNGLNYEIFKGLNNNTYESVYSGRIVEEED